MGKFFLERLDEIKTSGQISEEVYAQIKEAYLEEKNIVVKKFQPASYDKMNQVKEEKPKLSQEEQKTKNVERNITMILSIGIIFILLAGLILSTTTWNLMGNGLKTISLCMVSILFFSISVLTEKKLKIEKTSFAFWTLGVLFLPVILLSISFFSLFGEYLSMEGQGSCLFGMFSALVCMPFYIVSTIKYKKQVFVFLSILSTISFFTFLSAQFYLKGNSSFGIIIYLLVLTGVYQIIKRNIPNYHFSLGMLKWCTIIPYFYVFVIYLITIFMDHLVGQYELGVKISWIIMLCIWIAIGIYWSNQMPFGGMGVFASIAVALISYVTSDVLPIEEQAFTQSIIIFAGLILFYFFFYFFHQNSILSKFKLGIDIAVITLLLLTVLIEQVQLPIRSSILFLIISVVVGLTTYRAKNTSYHVLLGAFGAFMLFISTNVLISGIQQESNYDLDQINLFFILQLVVIITLYLGCGAIFKWYKSFVGKGFLMAIHLLSIILWVIGRSEQLYIQLFTDIIFIGICFGCYLFTRTEKMKAIYFYVSLYLGLSFMYVVLKLTDGRFGIISSPRNSLLLLCLLLFGFTMSRAEVFRKRVGILLIILFPIGLTISELLLIKSESTQILFFILLVLSNISFAVFVKRNTIGFSWRGNTVILPDYKMILPQLTGFLLFVDLVRRVSLIDLVEIEIIMVSTVILMDYIRRHFFGTMGKKISILFSIWYTIAGITIFVEVGSDSLQAVIYGVIFIISIIYGYIKQERTYFIGGSIFLIVGVIFNTLEFWSRIPWWVYLLTTGTILIVFAVRNEIRK